MLPMEIQNALSKQVDEYLKVNFSIEIPHFESKVPSMGRDIYWNKKDSRFIISNDVGEIELYYQSGEFDFNKSFAADTGKFKIRGWVLVGSVMWIVDANSLTLQSSSKSPYKLPSKISDPSGLTFDGIDFYVADKGSNKIYKLRKENKKLVLKNSFSITSKPIRGITYDDNGFWICDKDTIYYCDKQMRLKRKYPIAVSIDGITIRDNAIWACGLNKAELYRFYAQENRGEPEVILFPGFQKGQKDDLAEVIFKTPPAHVENSSLADKQGLFKIYELPTNDGSPTLSAITVAFQKNDTTEKISLDEFVTADLIYYLKFFPNATVSPVMNFPKDVTAHLSEQKIPFVIYITQGNMTGYGQEFLGDSLVLFFETPGGFWSISWSTPKKVIEEQPDSFFFFIKDMRIILKA
jgi:hypothetical protein